MELSNTPHAAAPEPKSKQRVCGDKPRECDLFPSEINLANLGVYMSVLGDVPLSLEDVARITGSKRGTIDQLIRSGELRAFQLGDRRKVMASNVRELMRAIMSAERWKASWRD